MRHVLTNATVIDCVTPRPIPGASVVIDRGRIVEVLDGSRSPDTRSADVVDLGGAYLLPGLWDVHIPPHYPAPTRAPGAQQPPTFGPRLTDALPHSGALR